MVVLSSWFIKAISSNFAEPVFAELELTRDVAAAAISCGLVKRKFIPLAALVGTMLNSSPFNGLPKNESLNPSVSTVVLPVTGVFNVGADNVQRSVFSS